jgi:transcriptional regulator with XRE-family HTH domain
MEQLKRLRKERGLSQAKLAALADIDPSTMNQIERGAREPSTTTLRKLATALDVTLAELLDPKGIGRSSLEPTLLNGLDEERHLDDDGALAILFRGLARRAQLIVERSRREGPSVGLGEELTALHQEANALYRLRGRRDIRGTRSEELADAEGAYEEVESTIQAMIRQDVGATDEERDTARRFRPDAGDASKRRKADAS